MPAWLLIWIARFASGERFRKATPEELRSNAAFFLFIPIWGACFVKTLGFMDRSGVISIWLMVTAAGAVLLGGSHLWAKFVPAKFSWIMGGAVWAIVVILALLGRVP